MFSVPFDIQFWTDSRCDPTLHVWMRIYYRSMAGSCMFGCWTDQFRLPFGWYVVHKVAVTEGTNEIRINEWVELTSAMDIPFSVDIYPWPTY